MDKKLDKRDKYVLALGLLSGVRIKLVGTFFGNEILLLLLLVYGDNHFFKENKNVVKLLRLGVLWVFGLLFSDIYNSIPILDTLKGSLHIILFLLQIPVAYTLLKDKPSRYLYYFVGCAITSVPCYFIFGNAMMEANDYMKGDIWLYYSLLPVGTGIIGYLYFKQKFSYKFIYALSFLFSVFMLYHGSRNFFLITALAIALMVYIDYCKTCNTAEFIKKFRTHSLTLFLSLFFTSALLSTVYEFLASTGYLGEAAYTKYMNQKEGGSILTSGRMVTFMGVELIKRNPIIGYGSYAKDEGGAFYEEYFFLNDLKYESSALETRELPAHSHIVGAWMNNGILGGVFWIFVISIMLKSFRKGSFLLEPRMLYLYLITFIAISWDILFSPFANRVNMSFFLVYTLILYRQFILNSNQVKQ